MRGNQGIAIIQAFQSGQIQKAYETALNSAGSAQKEFDSWSKSIEAHIETFKASFESLSKSLIKDNFLIGLVDSGTKFIDILDKIINDFGTIPTLIGLTLICVIYFIVYIILGCIAYKERYERRQLEHNINTMQDLPKKEVKQVEVVIKEGTWEHVQIENLKEKVDILALQAESISKDIDKTEEQIQIERYSTIGDKAEINRLVKLSLNLQAKKNDIENKIIKYNKEIIAIATKYYKQSMC